MNELTIEKNNLHVVSEFKPAGDQPTAIDELVEGLGRGEKNQVFHYLLLIESSSLIKTLCH